MQDQPTIQCPECGRTDVKLLRQSPFGGINRYGKPASATVAYQCVCGMGFTETFRTPGAAPPASDRLERFAA
ncbi:MAG: hypothetical protein IAF94_14590 [Pirellulaceae bacterium]|nr:hypothetical protein [Pirellulaceae bacterium]